LNKIKEKNEGTPVIILTASTKAWNMRKLFDAGANAYYIKEAPLQWDSVGSISNLNQLIQDISSCADKVYLRSFYNISNEIRSKMKSHLRSYASTDADQIKLFNFELSVGSKLDMSFKLLISDHNKEQHKYHRFALLMLHQILEEYVSLSFIYKEGDGKKSPSKVQLLDKSYLDVYSQDSQKELAGNVVCNFRLITGSFDYSSDKKTPVEVKFGKDSFKPDANSKSQSKQTTLFKLISVFKERHGASEAQCARLIELTYLRSNLCAHNTGKIDTKKRDVEVKDIMDALGFIAIIAGTNTRI
jgi:CheY-like chemotaxis protein